uniref:Uncharacterized protein n=1 Tax=Mycolicibacterium gilvum (strain PYR-GCK) TaxID=350054 RepID=A4T1Z9_MYCGI|nr:hypothetical protein Mflv_2827 [Mycolicibacterium gilvum PYR-GCK]
MTAAPRVDGDLRGRHRPQCADLALADREMASARSRFRRGEVSLRPQYAPSRIASAWWATISPRCKRVASCTGSDDDDDAAGPRTPRPASSDRPPAGS